MSDATQHELICFHCGVGLIEEEDEYFHSSRGYCHNNGCWPEYRDKKVGGNNFYVNVYLIDRAYGGPEEGGWWYDYGEAIRCMGSFKTYSKAVGVQCKVENLFVNKINKGRRSIGSVLSEGVYYVAIEHHPVENYPKVRPHYE